MPVSHTERGAIDAPWNSTSTSNNPGTTRRHVLMGGVALAAAAMAPSGGFTRSAQAKDAAPNIVYIIADDLGWGDAGFHGSDIATPNMDKLAGSGASLEQFYTLPMCTPTRAAFLTGRYPLRYGLQTGVIPAAGAYGIPLDEYLLPQTLKAAGYQTALVGKWHLGHAKTDLWRASVASIRSMARWSVRSTISSIPPTA